MQGPVLFLSRDRGSVQTSVPVLAALAARPEIRTHVVSMAVSRGVLDDQAIASEPLDETHFAAAPSAAIAALVARVAPSLVVSGSSPARGPAPETPEQHLVIEARRRGIASLAILDYWGMYRERFAGADGRMAPALVPDRICALDTHCAADLVALGVPPERVAVTHNPWLDAVAARARAPGPASPLLAGPGLRLVFVSQPFAETAGARGWGFSQDALLATLVEALPPAPLGAAHRILVWPHPAEDPGRWLDARAFGRPDVEVVVTDERGPAVLAHADLLVSRHSTVAYEALHYGTPCLSLRPAIEGDAALITEVLGLTARCADLASLRAFLAGHDVRALRGTLARRSAELAASGVFFSDGHATHRVIAEIERMLAAAEGRP